MKDVEKRGKGRFVGDCMGRPCHNEPSAALFVDLRRGHDENSAFQVWRLQESRYGARKKPNFFIVNLMNAQK